MLATTLFWAALALGFLATRLAEWWLHQSHYRILRRAGAEEAVPWLMRSFYLLSGLLLPAVALEQLFTYRSVAREALALGLLLVGLAVGLRFWAIRSLGVHWSMRCLALAGARSLNAGPYRYLSHPEYLSRLVEALGLGLAFAAPWTTGFYLVLALGLALVIARAESRQLQGGGVAGVDLTAAVE